jgi:hypothetical protein
MFTDPCDSTYTSLYRKLCHTHRARTGPMNGLFVFFLFSQDIPGSSPTFYAVGKNYEWYFDFFRGVDHVHRVYTPIETDLQWLVSFPCYICIRAFFFPRVCPRFINRHSCFGIFGTFGFLLSWIQLRIRYIAIQKTFKKQHMNPNRIVELALTTD